VVVSYNAAPMTLTVYHYPRCSTCRQALKWLDGRHLPYRAIDIVADPPSAATLARLHELSGVPIKRFFNTSGDSYRAGGFSARLPVMTDDEAYAALAADGKLIKRPLVDAGTRVLVGFTADEWAETLSDA
jgi:arsenate reductase